MAIDWDALVLGPVMGIFGEGVPASPDTRPLYEPRGRAAFRLADAVFDAAYEQVDIGDGGEPVTSHRPVLGVRLSLFERPPKQNDRVFIPSVGTWHLVKDVQPDGHGHAKLMLMVEARK